MLVVLGSFAFYKHDVVSSEDMRTHCCKLSMFSSNLCDSCRWSLFDMTAAGTPNSWSVSCSVTVKPWAIMSDMLQLPGQDTTPWAEYCPGPQECHWEDIEMCILLDIEMIWTKHKVHFSNLFNVCWYFGCPNFHLINRSFFQATDKAR